MYVIINRESVVNTAVFIFSHWIPKYTLFPIDVGCGEYQVCFYP